MSLMTFSIREMVPLILSGKKAQTTRLVGKRKLKVGDTLYLYFKPRMKKGTCKNCINTIECGETLQQRKFIECSGCDNWNNYFGEATVTKIEIIVDALTPQGTDPGEVWAKLDGFENFTEACKWFIPRYGIHWWGLDFQVISWKPKWLEDKNEN